MSEFIAQLLLEACLQSSAYRLYTFNHLTHAYQQWIKEEFYE